MGQFPTILCIYKLTIGIRAMNWNAWPQNSQGKIIVPTEADTTLQAAGKAAGKTFLMGVSPLQFKHCCGGNWYDALKTTPNVL